MSSNPQIFISYARSSAAQAAYAARALREAGFEVWWDDQLPAHRPYADVIEERLAAAKAVLVLWSSDAVRSQWVRAEADAARQAGKLVQLNLDGASLPMPFSQIQCPAIGPWDGGRGHPLWSRIEESIAELVGCGRSPPPAATPATAGTSVCVLPFANTSGDPDQEYFSDGITEDLITDISQLPGVAVVARNTSFTFKGRPANVTAVAAQLGVSHVVEGSVRKSGNRLRIIAQLIDGRTGHQLWGERYDRDLAEVFDVQDEISAAIVSALRLKLSPEETDERSRRDPDPIAYQDYLKGRHCWNRGTEDALHGAVALFQNAIARDPEYARAYAGLADAFVQLGAHTYLDPQQAYRQARAAAQAAIELDPHLSDAHASLGLIAFVHEWNAAAAEAHLRQAVELDPASVTARLHFSRVLSSTGRHDAAVAQAQAAVDLDPLSVAAVVQLASAVNIAGMPDKSIERLRRAAVIFPDQFRIYYLLVFALGSAGRGDEAVEAAEHAIAIAGRTMFAIAALGYAKALAGATAEAGQIAAEMEQASTERYICPFDIAVIHAALGDREKALAWLRQALKMRDHAMLFAKVDPALASLRNDPEFEALVAGI